MLFRSMRAKLAGWQVKWWDKTRKDGLPRLAGTGIIEKIHAWENKLIQPKSQSYDDVINFVNRLSANIIFVHGEMNNNVPYVTAGAIARHEELHEEWLVYKNEMDTLLKKDIVAFNALCQSLSIGNVLLPE